MFRLLAFLGCLVCSQSAISNPPAQTDPGTVDPPIIGLVLSGGGTKGGAHIGVLRVLEANGIRPDLVVGTSVGAIIGAMYATGLTPDEIEHAIGAIDWDDVLRDEPARENIPIQLKRRDFEDLVRQRPGFTEGELRLPLGITQGQKVTALLRRLLSRGEGIHEFDQLAIPFRAVATSLATGEAVTLARGDLALSVRASMSIPGLFAPVKLNSDYLVDGAAAANLPIDVARDMGAERIIAVDITSPLNELSDIQSVLDVTQQLIDIMTKRNADQQIRTLAANDILIRPQVADFSTLDFERTLEAVPHGVAAAQQVEPQLRALAAEVHAGARNAQPRYGPPQTAPQDPVIAFIDVEDTSGLRAAAVQARLGLETGKRFDRQALEEKISLLYGTGLYQTIDYNLVRREDVYGLKIRAESKAWGPNYLQFGLRLEEDFYADANFDLSVAYERTELNNLGAQWRTQLDVGQRQGLSTAWYLPWNDAGRLFTRARIGYERNTVRLYDDDDDAIAELRLQELGFTGSIGRQIGRASEVELGGRRLFGRANELVGEFDLPDERFDIGEVSLSYRRDTLNRSNRPSKGSLLRLSAISSSDYTGGTEDYEQLLGMYKQAFRYRRYQLAATAMVGTTLNDNAPVQSQMFLGGLGRLSGHPSDRFFDNHLAFVRLNGSREYQRFAMPLFIGASLEAGNTWAEDFGNGPDEWITAGSVYAGFDSFVGPVYLAAGFAEGGHRGIYLYLGNPFAPRPIRIFD